MHSKLAQRPGRNLLGATCLLTGLALGAGVHAAPVFSVGDVSVWNVGSGQVNGDFQIASDAVFTGGALELGIRATERKVGNTTPDGNVYSYDAGHSAGGSASDSSRARWNFDLHIDYAGTIADLDILTLEIISSNPVNMPSAGIFDLLDGTLRSAIDCHSIAPTACASDTPPAGASSSPPHTPNPTNFYQASQNAVFGWFTPTFNFDAPGTYTFRLTAVEGTTTLSTGMVVDVPEPATAALLLAAVAGLGARRRAA